MVLDYAQTLMNDLPILFTGPDEAPSYAHAGDAGVDLRSSEDGVIQPGERKTVGTSLHIAIPAGFVGLVHSRSGLAAKNGVIVLNSPGTVDAGYRGEIKVTLLNTDKTAPFVFKIGDRIAQLVFQRVEQAKFISVKHLPDSDRGAGGFGSTGVK
jgi:dUTP pyrophosphatase